MSRRSRIALRDAYLFFFSSRRRHTILQGDWSSDVCSSDLRPPLGEQRLEALGLVEGADQRQAESRAADHVPRDALDVLGGHRVEAREQLLGLDRRALEHLPAQAEQDQPVRALGLQDEAALRERPRLLELLLADQLVRELAKLVR